VSYQNATYVIFDGDTDKWAYAYMKGWKQNENTEFDFIDAHDLDNMTSRAQGEYYVKSHLKERMNNSSAVIVLVGANTKNLFKFVRWEMELALELGLPVVAVNLNNKTQMDPDRCPPIIRDGCVVHIPFKMAEIKRALGGWPSEFRLMNSAAKLQGARYYNDPPWYKSMGL